MAFNNASLKASVSALFIVECSSTTIKSKLKSFSLRIFLVKSSIEDLFVVPSFSPKDFKRLLDGAATAKFKSFPSSDMLR